MARKKFKLTGFARFLLVMVVLAPLAFIGASYYNGEDGIENLKRLFKGNFNFDKKEIVVDEEPKEEKNDESKALIDTAPSEVEINSQVAKLQDELDYKSQKVDSLYKENAVLKSEIEAKEKELREVKDQLEKIKSAISQ
jgi:peptidoglycan hydrolase CwlO-like protein